MFLLLSVSVLADEIESKVAFYMQRADSLQLPESMRWKRILLYRDHKLGAESDVDGGFFFLSPEGKTNPRAEMEASLRGFFHLENVYAKVDTPASEFMHPQVKFPLRMRYLAEKLQIPDTAFPQIDRSRFERWMKALNPDRISVAFASAYLGNPASAMGHTFLRVHSKQNSGQRDVLDYGINYAGNTPPGENMLLYSLKGMLGFYPGTYGLLPYYVSLQKYIHIENRDLWFYYLNLSPTQQWELLAQLWELGNSWEHYFFFTENCSYFIAAIVDGVLEDDVSLLDSIPYAMVPIEIVKGMQKIPGLVDSVSWRPSTLSKVRDRFQSMSPAQKKLVNTLLFEDSTVWDSRVVDSKLSKDELSLVFDVGLDYSLVQKRKYKDSTWIKRNESLLKRRMSLRAPSLNVTYSVDTAQQAPHRVHDPYRIEFGGGIQNYERFGILGFRLSYQDANQFDEGLKPNNILDFMDARLRVWEGKGKLQLDYLRILQLANYAVIRDVKYPTSWRLDLRLDRPPQKGDSPGNDKLSPYGAIASGYSWDYWGNQRLVGFGLLGGRLRLHEDFHYYTSLGPMLNTGLKARIAPWLSLLFTTEATYSIVGKPGLETHHEAELRLGGPELEIRFAGSRWNHRNEGAIRILCYY